MHPQLPRRSIVTEGGQGRQSNLNRLADLQCTGGCFFRYDPFKRQAVRLQLHSSCPASRDNQLGTGPRRLYH
jgi:hypothetical protein